MKIVVFCFAFALLGPLSLKAEVVLTSIKPVELILKEILPQNFRVSSLLSAQQDPHFYQPKPSDLKRLEESSLFVIVQRGFDFQLRSQSTPTLELLSLLPRSAQFRRGFRVDPHFWLSPQTVNALLDPLTRQLCQSFDQSCEEIENRSKEFSNRLEHLIQNSPALGDLSIFISHDSISYFCRDLKIECSSFQSGGHHHESSPKEISRAIEKLRSKKRLVLLDEVSIQSQSIRVIAEALNVKSRVLDTLGASAESYEELFQNLIRSIAPDSSKGNH